MKGIEKAERIVVNAVVFLVPLAVLHLFTNPFTTPKLAILVFGVVVLLLIKCVKMYLKGGIGFSTGSFDFPVLLLAASYLISGLVKTQNKMEAFFLPGTATAIIAGAFLYLLIIQSDEKTKKGISNSIYLSGVVVALGVLIASAGVFRGINQLPQFIRDTGFTLVGGSLSGIIFLAAVLPFGLNLLTKEKDVVKKSFWGVSLALLIFGTVISLFNVLPGKPSAPQLPDFNTSWIVAVDSLKFSPLLGVGPGNYIYAFNRLRPLTFNQTELWRLRFTSARNYGLSAVTETGLLGTAALILIVYSVIRMIRTNNDKERKLVGWNRVNNTSLISLSILGVSLLLFPINIVFIMLLFVLLALNAEVQKVNLGSFYPAGLGENQASKNVSAWLPLAVVSLPVIVGTVALSYYSYRALYAEYVYRNALIAVLQNDGSQAYTLLGKAINKNPYVDRYHTSYAQVNLGLANALSQKEDITDQDRSNIASLIQQAIREGKATVALNPMRASNWEVLGRIYQAIMPLAQGADVFAAQTFSQAVALDPFNPDLRISLGGIYYAKGDFDSAMRIFEYAVAVKQDLPNSHYNLAYAYKGRGEIEKAINEMSTVLSLVDRNSKDFETAKAAIEEFESQKASVEPKSSENLTPPQEGAEPVLEPPIELPEDSEPPQPVKSPEPSATPEPTLKPGTSPTPIP